MAAQSTEISTGRRLIAVIGGLLLIGAGAGVLAFQYQNQYGPERERFLEKKTDVEKRVQEIENNLAETRAGALKETARLEEEAVQLDKDGDKKKAEAVRLAAKNKWKTANGMSMRFVKERAAAEISLLAPERDFKTAREEFMIYYGAGMTSVVLGLVFLVVVFARLPLLAAAPLGLLLGGGAGAAAGWLWEELSVQSADFLLPLPLTVISGAIAWAVIGFLGGFLFSVFR